MPGGPMPGGPGTQRLGLIMAVYLLGLLVGGLYVGMVSPARTVVQASMGLDDSVGIWMVNIYTLFYAATIPISGKLADRHGRKLVFTWCIGIFCLGAVMCGLSQAFGSFGLLLAGRVIQACGAGGVIPVATAEMGTSFPEDKRGLALGLAAAVSGISNVLGTVCGSFILGLTGEANWCVLFYLSVPFCAAIVAASLAWLPNNAGESKGGLDLAGSLLLASFVLALLLGIKNVDFFDLGTTLVQPGTWVPLLVAVVLVPVFALVERRADDPVFQVEYFRNSRIVITMAVSFFVGCCIISTVLFPEFAEDALGVPRGSGGYYVAVFGLFAIAGPPVGGKIIDKRGAKPVLIGGLCVSIVGFLFLAFVATAHPSTFTLLAGLSIVGLGMGFTMGTPLNYMILQNTDPSQSTSAIATLSLVRQMGTSLAPAILVGFLTQGLGMTGYLYMFACIALFNLASLVLMVFYRERRD